MLSVNCNHFTVGGLRGLWDLQWFASVLLGQSVLVEGSYNRLGYVVVLVLVRDKGSLGLWIRGIGGGCATRWPGYIR